MARHAQAEIVSVIFDWDAPMLRLVIQDNGQGSSGVSLSEQPSSHLGIEGMRQRASVLGRWRLTPDQTRDCEVRCG